MTFDFLYLGLAVFFLWLPRSFLRFGRVGSGGRNRGSNFDDPDFNKISMKTETRNFRNWVDLLRAGTGAWLVLFVAVGTDEYATPAVSYWTFTLQGTLVGIGILMQTYRRVRGEWLAFAPMFYLVGIIGGIGGPLAGLFSLLAMVLLTLGVAKPSPWITVLGLLGGLFSFMFEAGVARSLLAGGLVLMPVLVSLLMRKNMRLYSKRLPRKR